jgi:hypothetical protein
MGGMTAPAPKPRLAVLIDGENISSDTAPQIFREAEALGEVVVRRVYGDPSNAKIQKWLEQLVRWRLVYRASFCHAKPAKNSADIALCIDAMDLLHTTRLDGYCVVSSDSDFSHLAMRVREHGLDIFGFGENKVSQAHRGVFSGFTVISKPAPKTGETARTDERAATLQQPSKAEGRPPPSPPSGARPFLHKAMSAKANKGDGWTPATAAEDWLAANEPTFGLVKYGVVSLGDLIRKDTGYYEFQPAKGKVERFRMSPAAQPKTPKT